VRQRKARRVQRLGGEECALPSLCAAFDGYALHAGVLIAARDRKGLRRLAGYIARPPLALDRVEALPGDRVRIAWKRPWSDGTTALELSAEELAERLVALVPPPRANQVLYGGVLTSRHRWHRAVRPRPPTRRAAPAGVGVRLTKTGSGSSRWTPWSLLLWRVFGVNGLACPTCGKVMVLRAAVRPPATLSVLASLERSARGPPAGTESAAGAERREPRSPEPECSGTGARRGLGAAQPAPTRARGVSEAGAVGENPGFPWVGAARARGGARLSEVGRARSCGRMGLGVGTQSA